MFRFSIVIISATLVFFITIPFSKAEKNGGNGTSITDTSKGAEIHGYPSHAGFEKFRLGNIHIGPNSYPIHSYPRSNGSFYPSPDLSLLGLNISRPSFHYQYDPPSQIQFASSDSGPLVDYPVYHGILPPYVYQYRSLGTKYAILIAGLALFNLGVLNNSNVNITNNIHHMYNYRPQLGELCFFGLKKENEDYEEIKIDCMLVGSFFSDVTEEQNYESIVTSPNEGGTSVNNTYNAKEMLTETKYAEDVKGNPIELKPGMQCYVIKKKSSSTMKKDVSCGLLQAYADKSFKIRPQGALYPWGWGGSSGGVLRYLSQGPRRPYHHGCVIDSWHGRGGRRRPSPTSYRSGIYRSYFCNWYQRESLNYQICVPHNYCYNPPQQIHYVSSISGFATYYPVYRGQLPIYIYKYKDSGSKYSTLLTGLALFDLGINIYAVCNGSSEVKVPFKNYRPQSNEICLFGIQNQDGTEEAKIDCLELISGFMYAEQIKQYSLRNMEHRTNNVTKPTAENSFENDIVPSLYVVSTWNSSTTPVITMSITNSSAWFVPSASENSTTSSEETPSSVFNAIDVKGTPVDITPEMECYVKRTTFNTLMKIKFPCGVLQTYAEESLKPISAFDVEIVSAKSIASGYGNINYLGGSNSSKSHPYPRFSPYYPTLNNVTHGPNQI